MIFEKLMANGRKVIFLSCIDVMNGGGCKRNFTKNEATNFDSSAKKKKKKYIYIYIYMKNIKNIK